MAKADPRAEISPFVAVIVVVLALTLAFGIGYYSLTTYQPPAASTISGPAQSTSRESSPVGKPVSATTTSPQKSPPPKQ